VRQVQQHELLKPTMANLFGLEIRFKAADEAQSNI